MRAHVLNGTTIVNTIVVEALDQFPELTLIDAENGGVIGDLWDGEAFHPAPPPPPTVPERVTRRQARQALLLAGLLDRVQPAINAIPDATERGLAQIEWEDSQTFERSRPFLNQVGAALGLAQADIDRLFITAGSL